MIWHIWWLAAVSTIAMFGSYIVYTFQKNKDYYVEVDEVQAIEDAFFDQIDADGSVPVKRTPNRDENLSMPA